MFDPNAPGNVSPVSTEGANPNARYNYLVGRLRSRQITMEEATELFGLLQGMLARSEAGRQALMAASRTRGLSGGAPPTPAAPKVVAASGGSDDMVVFGLLAMGAGAGLIAALSKRIQEGAPPPKSGTPASR